MKTIYIIKMGSTTPSLRQALGDFDDWIIADLIGENIHAESHRVSHNQSVLELSPGAESLASSTTDLIEAFSFGSSTWGVQFHPEFSPDIMRHYIKANRYKLQSFNHQPTALIESIHPTPVSASVLQHFFNICLLRQHELAAVVGLNQECSR